MDIILQGNGFALRKPKEVVHMIQLRDTTMVQLEQVQSMQVEAVCARGIIDIDLLLQDTCRALTVIDITVVMVDIRPVKEVDDMQFLLKNILPADILGLLKELEIVLIEDIILQDPFIYIDLGLLTCVEYPDLQGWMNLPGHQNHHLHIN